nr:diaminopimelate epimerase [Rhodoferax sp.]
MTAEFAKYEALGNDYIVLDPTRIAIRVTEASVKRLCDRHRGIGADGVLYGPFFDDDAIRLQIFNSDGSECKKSGNGLRVFAHYLLNHGHVSGESFILRTPAGDAAVKVVDLDKGVFTIAMGDCTFDSHRIPATGPKRTLLNERLEVNGEIFRIGCVNVGNPHCVVLVENCSQELALKFGPLIARHEMFPQGTNVQFVRVRDRGNLDAEIWERGSGYTLASGSSACAIASVLHAIGLTEPKVTVHMPGGKLMVSITPSREIHLTGESRSVIEGRLACDLVEHLVALE